MNTIANNKSFFVVIICFLISYTSQCCVCENYDRTINATLVKPYVFIAHVKILADEDSNLKDEFAGVGKLSFKIIELFKGDSITGILEYSKNSSCDMGISVGEEWILFARKSEDNIFIDACDLNVQYRSSFEVKDWTYRRGINELNELKMFYDHPAKKFATEKHIEYYSNGQVEIEESYVNGRLNGEKKIWYPDGKLVCSENYDNDTLNGRSQWFYPTGQIKSESFHMMGKPCNISRTYFDSTDRVDWQTAILFKQFQPEDSIFIHTNKVQVKHEFVYDETGWVILSREYNRMGRIEEETIIDPKKKYRVHLFYHANGTVSSMMYSLGEKNIGRYQEYGENGFPSQGWDYDENGEKKPLGK